MDQTKVTDYVARKLKNNNSKNTQVQDAHNLFQNGKKVGNITRTDKHITVKLNSSALSADKEETLKIFIANLINDE